MIKSGLNYPFLSTGYPQALNKIRKGFSEKDFFLTGADGIYIEPRVYQNYYKNMLKSSKVKEYN